MILFIYNMLLAAFLFYKEGILYLIYRPLSQTNEILYESSYSVYVFYILFSVYHVSLKK